jgi:hypothetical protein
VTSKKRKPTKRKKKSAAQSKPSGRQESTQHVNGVEVVPCSYCGVPHEGNKGSLRAQATLDETAQVFYDREVASAEIARLIDGLCGPRFRLETNHLRAFFGHPARRWVVLQWDSTAACGTEVPGRWTVLMNTGGER